MKGTPENEILGSESGLVSEQALDALNQSVDLLNEGVDLAPDEIEEIIKDVPDEEKEEIRELIGYAKSLENWPSPVMSKEAKERDKQ